ncbi:hypothetical protein L596_016719 [Steinernema carpocapsae]|uniref:RNase NYN domain-containing protein n=1 Tax=Steinernema carpocapsae TaxID=34508 RepID=A0A4U5NJL7_STECR|nr:hypothetical protein L596_016719 [Steinernema carpocapsae]
MGAEEAGADGCRKSRLKESCLEHRSDQVPKRSNCERANIVEIGNCGNCVTVEIVFGFIDGCKPNFAFLDRVLARESAVFDPLLLSSGHGPRASLEAASRRAHGGTLEGGPFEGDLRPPPVRSPPRCHRRHELSSQGGGECASPVPPTARGHTGLPRRPGPRRAPLLLPPAQLRRPRRHPKNARYRAKNGYLFDIYYCMGLLVYADNCYDDLPTIDIASRRHGVIVSCDKYRDILALQIGSNKRRLLEERAICPTLTPFKAPDGAMVTKLANGDMVVHFLTHLTVESHTQLYSHPDSLDFACVAYFRAAFTPTRRAKLLANLDEVFEFVPRVTALADDNEYVRQIADYKNAIVDRWRAECCFKRIDEVTYSWAQRYQPFQS